MSQSTDELTRSALRAIRGHYRRRVWLAFLIPALLLSRLAGCCSRTKTPTPVRRPRQRPGPPSVAPSPGRSSPRTVWPPSRKQAPCWSGPPRRSRTGGSCSGPRRLPGGQDRSGRGSPPLGPDHQGGVGRRRPLRRASRDLQEGRHHLQIGRHPTLDRLDQLACRNADGFSSALTGNAPRFFRPPPWCCAVPPTASTGHSSYLPTQGGVMPLPPRQGSGLKA